MEGVGLCAGAPRSQLTWLLFVLLLCEECQSLASAEKAAAKSSLEIYSRKDSSVMLPGLDDSLEGNGVLEWKKGDSWILTFYYGSNEPEMHHMYENRAELQLLNGSLLLRNLTEKDGGVYTLQVKLKDIKTMILKILEPVGLVSITRILSNSNCTVHLECKASGDVWNFNWEKNGKPLNSSSLRQQGNISLLTTEGPGVESLGTYTCIAKNPVSENKRDYELQDMEIWRRLISLGCGIIGLMLVVPNVFCICLTYCWPNRGGRLLESFLHTVKAGTILSHISAIVGYTVIHEERITTGMLTLIVLSFVLTLVLHFYPSKCLKSHFPLLKCSGVEKVWDTANLIVLFGSGTILVVFNLTYWSLCSISSHLPWVIGVSIASASVFIIAVMIIAFYTSPNEDTNEDLNQSCTVMVEQDGHCNMKLLEEQDGQCKEQPRVEQDGQRKEQLQAEQDG